MKKKIYITSLHLKHGGIEMAITLLANALKKRGYEVEILCTYDLGAPVYKLEDEVSITYLTDVVPNREAFKEAIANKNPYKILKQGMYAVKVLYLKRKSMKDKIKDISEGVIIATRNEHAVLLSKFGNDGVKKIAQLHHDHQFEPKLLKDFRDNYSKIDEFVLLTESVKSEIAQIMEKNKHTRLVVIPNFLEEVRQESPTDRKKQVIAVGRMHEVKGFLRLLDIWKDTEVDKDIVLKIVGDGEQYNDIKSAIQSLGLEDRVILPGILGHEQVLEEMKNSLLYVMTSFTEAFPYVLIEAMSAGLPLVAYDVRVGPRAIIVDGVNGYLVVDDDKKDFADKLKEILEDKEKWKRMSLESEKFALNFSEEKVLEKWIEIIEKDE